jgi:hypothetical protein
VLLRNEVSTYALQRENKSCMLLWCNAENEIVSNTDNPSILWVIDSFHDVSSDFDYIIETKKGIGWNRCESRQIALKVAPVSCALACNQWSSRHDATWYDAKRWRTMVSLRLFDVLWWKRCLRNDRVKKKKRERKKERYGNLNDSLSDRFETPLIDWEQCRPIKNVHVAANRDRAKIPTTINRNPYYAVTRMRQLRSAVEKCPYI